MTPLQEFLKENNDKIENIILKWGIQKESIAFNKKKSQTLEWFENFIPSEHNDALLILEKLNYIDDNRIKRYIEHASAELENLFGSNLKSVLFYSLGLSSASSGSQYLYGLLKDLELPEDNFKIDDFKQHLQNDISIVFIDDIIGSGNQAITFFNKHLKDSKAKCYYISLFGFQDGVNAIKENAKFEKVIECKTLSEEEMAFSRNSYIFKDEAVKIRIKEICEKYGKLLYPKHPLGYDNSQALLVFPHNTPNNTLPIIWAGTKNEKVAGKIWLPLWERKKKKKEKEKPLSDEKIINVLPDTSSNNKLNSYNKPTKLFTGRKEKLDELSNAFEKNNIISLTGIGGIGKTQLTLKLVEKIVQENNKLEITWQEFQSSTRFDNFIIAAGFGNIIQSNTSESDRFIALIDKLNEYSRIVVWDNFHDNTDNTFLNFLRFSEHRLNGSKMIIISRTNELINDIKNIELNDFKESQAYAKILIKERHPNLNLSEQEITKICGYVKGHPLAIELALNLCRSIALKNVIGKLTRFNGKTDELSKRLYQEILNSENTSQKEKDFLYAFSIFKDKVSEEDIIGIFGEEIIYTLPSLKEKYLIEYDSLHYDTHPLIREFCYTELESKKDLHSKVANWLISKRTETLDVLLEERIFHHLTRSDRIQDISIVITKHGREYVRKALFRTLLEMLDLLLEKDIHLPLFNILRGDIHQLKRDLNNAYLSFEKVKNNSMDIELSVEGLLKCGDVHRLNSKNDEALKLFLEAETFSKQNNLKKYIAWSYNNIALIKELKGHYQEAFILKFKALEISEELNIEEDIATLYINIGSNYKNPNYTIFNLTKALSYYQKSLALNIKLDNKHGIAIGYRCIGSVYLKEQFEKFNLHTSLKFLNQSLKISIEIGDKNGTSDVFNSKGLIYNDENFDKYNPHKAIEYYKKSLEIKTNIRDMRGIARVYVNITSPLVELNNYKDAFISLFTAFSISKEINDTQLQKRIKDEVGILRTYFTRTTFIKQVKLAIEELDYKRKKTIVLSEFLNEPIMKKKTPNRNDIVKVEYKNGEIVTKKYKNLKNDIDSELCSIIN